MDYLPLIPKTNVLPNLDVLPLLRELFQDEFLAAVPSKNLSKNIITSLQYQKSEDEGKEKYKNLEYVKNFSRKDNLSNFAENVLEAYVKHEEKLEHIRNAEKNIFSSHACYLNAEVTIIENVRIQDLLKLKRKPLFTALDTNHVKNYKLLQGEAGLPPQYQAKSDFRVQNFEKWRKRMKNMSQDSLLANFLNKMPTSISDKCSRQYLMLKKNNMKKHVLRRTSRFSSNKIEDREKDITIFKSKPNAVIFTDFKLGNIYGAEIQVKNVYTKGVKFQLKPTCPEGPFHVSLNEVNPTKLFPGLSFQLNVEFTPNTLDNVAEDIRIEIEGGHKLLIPLFAYLEPPILKTHKDISEYPRTIIEKIGSSYIECGSCFTGDIKVIKMRFCCYRGSGEFFVMSSENWSKNFVNSMTSDNLLEIPPFRVYPVFFKIEKNEVIDLFVEFFPLNSGTHVENIIIACDNGEFRNLDIVGDAVGWNSYFFSFQDSLTKKLPVHEDDDLKVKYYLNFGDTSSSGTVEKKFCVSNNSNMPFEFQWKIREANISNRQEKYLNLSKHQVKIEPESGTFNPNTILEFHVTVSFENAEIGPYRMILCLYVLNLPYQCIEEDNTIIQPTGLVRNLYSQSLYGEEDHTTLSPELPSIQGTYESLQESIKSYVKCQSKAQMTPKHDFCKTTCIPNPGLCAKPLKKSKTFFNIGENIEDKTLTCVCHKKATEEDSNSESYTSNNKEETSGPRNEVVWDYVDILVDEVELWIEITPTKVTLEPSVVDFCNTIEINEPPVFKNVLIVNYGRCPVKCEWVKPSKTIDITIKSTGYGQNIVHEENQIKDKKKIKNLDKRENLDDTDPDDNIKTKEVASSRAGSEKKCEKKYEEPFNVIMEPKSSFTVPGLSEFTCKVGISASKPGKIKKMLYMSVNDGDLHLNVIVLGKAAEKYVSISPDLLDFGVLKQGKRYSKTYKIQNKCATTLIWRINQFKFDFKEEKCVNVKEKEKKYKGILAKDDYLEQAYYLDARIPGFRCSLLEIQSQSSVIESSANQYILVLGDVKLPVLQISSPRFENAILAPSGKMYVGQKITKTFTLINKGDVDTYFTWGHPFGCHSRKIKVDICPKNCIIKKKKTLVIEISLTPLSEGILSHCYVPCFFCRSIQPLILAIIGLAENINVTFEIVDYDRQTHMEVKNFLKTPSYQTVLRIPWPVKICDPNLGMKYISEDDVLNMKCFCSKVEEEENRAYPTSKSVSSQMYNSSRQTFEKLLDSKMTKGIISDHLQVSSGEKDFDESYSYNVYHGKGSDASSVQKYISRQSSFDSIMLTKSHIEFFSVPYQTPIKRRFVIRNETPMNTSFKISVLYFKESTTPQKDKIISIKNYVMENSEKNDFKYKLEKDQPLVIVVEPSEGELSGFDAQCINVFVYSNTWGEYRDFLVCQIKGIETFHLKLFIQVVGHPIIFPMFENSINFRPILRFQPTSYVSKSVVKQIRVRNRSSIPLNVSWIVFLTEPVFKEEDENYNLCMDSNAYLDSYHSTDESAKSSKNYIPKNVSEGSSTFQNLIEIGDFSHQSGNSDVTAKNEKSVDTLDMCKSLKSFVVQKGESSSYFASDDIKSEIPQIPFLGQLNNQFFQVNPKEMSFDPFEEKKIMITFHPWTCKPKTNSQEFKGVLTCCVKLRAEDEKCCGLFYRPCGMNFVSELISFSATVDTPLISFDIIKDELKFLVDANAVIKAPSKKITISRKFFLKNNTQKAAEFKIEMSPGIIFRVKSVITIDKKYLKYNPEFHCVKVEPGSSLEMEMECSVAYKDVSYAYEQLKLSNKKAGVSDNLKMSNEDEEHVTTKVKKEPWHQFFDAYNNKNDNAADHCVLTAKDSMKINANRVMYKSDSVQPCRTFYDDRMYIVETEGEDCILPAEDDFSYKSQLPQHIKVIEEEVKFIQRNLVTQTLKAELHLSFPLIQINPECIDFGNVYIGDSSVRYCSLLNLTGFQTDFKIKSISNSHNFAIEPLKGNIPSTNYNSNNGKSIRIEFKPTRPGYCRESFLVYWNMTMEFDAFEFSAYGFGTWNEKFATPKVEVHNELQRVFYIRHN